MPNQTTTTPPTKSKQSAQPPQTKQGSLVHGCHYDCPAAGSGSLSPKVNTKNSFTHAAHSGVSETSKKSGRKARERMARFRERISQQEDSRAAFLERARQASRKHRAKCASRIAHSALMLVSFPPF
ncbi:hypothetical protein B0H14DRAFT_2637353 [Mycena olivaceomarginata]|nr:hypothetical protein B0H14DRAFT_2637353 [Mycena olivaceomarginata]